MLTNYTVDTTQLKPIKIWGRGVTIEPQAMAQIHNIANMPFVHKHVAVMPDAHWGMGSTVGSVIATKGAIIPAAVGVDIGCGMMAVRTNLIANDLPDNLFGMRSAIEKAVPHGRTNNGAPGDRGAWGNPSDMLAACYAPLADGLKNLMTLYPGLIKRDPTHQTINHMGTLGTGNHFIEVCLDENQAVWIMLHSGSRGIGNRIGSFFIELAKKDMQRWFVNLPDADLAYMPEGSEHFHNYVTAVHWAQEYAAINRYVILQATLEAVRVSLGLDTPLVLSNEAINCHHNYVAKEYHFGSHIFITRKGAVRAREGDLGIIPGSMGAKSFIVRGKGNLDSFHSCSHGAGRAMGRAEAKRRFTVADQIAATVGVECRKDADVVDETPGAYKDIDAVMAAQSDLIDIVHTLKQILCVKG